MLLSSLTFLFAALATATPFAQPADTPNTDDHTVIPVSADTLTTRGTRGVYICHSGNWGGGCWWTASPSGQCFQLGQVLEPWSSFGPDRGQSCELHNGPRCGMYDPTHTEKYSAGIRYPGLTDTGARTALQGFQRVGSFRCWAE